MDVESYLRQYFPGHIKNGEHSEYDGYGNTPLTRAILDRKTKIVSELLSLYPELLAKPTMRNDKTIQYWLGLERFDDNSHSGLVVDDHRCEQLGYMPLDCALLDHDYSSFDNRSKDCEEIYILLVQALNQEAKKHYQTIQPGCQALVSAELQNYVRSNLNANENAPEEINDFIQVCYNNIDGYCLQKEKELGGQITEHLNYFTTRQRGSNPDSLFQNIANIITKNNPLKRPKISVTKTKSDIPFPDNEQLLWAFSIDKNKPFFTVDQSLLTKKKFDCCVIS